MLGKGGWAQEAEVIVVHHEGDDPNVLEQHDGKAIWISHSAHHIDAMVSLSMIDQLITDNLDCVRHGSLRTSNQELNTLQGSGS